MFKITDWPRLLRNIFGPLILLLIVVLAYAAVIFGYVAFEYQAEWKAEQEVFEKLAANVDYEKQRLQTSSDSAQTYSSKYSLGTSDVYGIISGFLNKTLLTVSSYEFQWTESLTNQDIELKVEKYSMLLSRYRRMYDHAFQLNDDAKLEFSKPSTKIINIIFRSILPIFTTFAVGASVSALHSISSIILSICIRQKKYPAWTVGRNKMLRINVMASMAVATAYFVLCFFLTSLASSRWQDVSFADGIKITLNLIATLPPNVKQDSIIDAHTLSAIAFLIHSGTAYFVFALINLIKTWRISAFAIPKISDIQKADELDKATQVVYRARRAELFQKRPEEKKMD
ncbi:hypothetical protein B9Z55_021297 [Caenorhabditis nigoni]|uniref:Uncharacterized protein n=1 Tax=Caenorhabditis nigoni TaxID=1611254 RepID=A0A2G5TRI3_9PELO|nr:hypothetical protein B9Z55_021297 [Caenorhabditis nigoni]